MSTCRSCNAKIIWAKTLAGKAIPIDAKPQPAGNIHLNRGVAIYLTDEEQKILREEGTTFHVAHFATCPNAAQHRRKR